MEKKDLNALAANPKNPRKISPEKIEMLKKALARFGDISGIVYNRRTKQLVGGHQRKVAFENGELGIERQYDTPTEAGTVAEGVILFNGERFAYREVDWDEHTELAANIAANKGAGEWDYTLLSDALLDLDHNNVDLDLTLFDQAELDRVMGGWDSDIKTVEGLEESDEAAPGKIVITCKPDDKDAVLIYLKDKLLETAFEGVHVE